MFFKSHSLRKQNKNTQIIFSRATSDDGKYDQK